MNMINDNFSKYPILEYTYTSLPERFFSTQVPCKVPESNVIIFNKELARELELNLEFWLSKEGNQILVGNRILDGSKPIAQAYAGHQFGYFTMLGDGRACLLGEYVTKEGQRYDIQLKGSGRTPYSRGGDGKAALGPMLREYIISEAMHELGIPTTRSLAVTTTGEHIMRDRIEEGAILTRIAKGHIRVGTFQYAIAWGEKDELRALVDYTIRRFYPEGLKKENPYEYLLEEVVKSQAQLIAQWQLVGFIHGVMNTDNMSISGETIDYGPCAFMDVYDPKTVFSSIDTDGRYAYGNQPTIAAWNLSRFAETILSFLSDNQEKAVSIAGQSIKTFQNLYQDYWYDGMGRKLGIFHTEKEDRALIDTLLQIMLEEKADFTRTFLDLTTQRKTLRMFFSEEYIVWERLYMERLCKQRKTRNISIEEEIQLMQRNNPIMIPRNQRVEDVLQAASKGDYSALTSLLGALHHSYDYSVIDQYQQYCEVPQVNRCFKTYCGT